MKQTHAGLGPVLNLDPMMDFCHGECALVVVGRGKEGTFEKIGEFRPAAACKALRVVVDLPRFDYWRRRGLRIPETLFLILCAWGSRDLKKLLRNAEFPSFEPDRRVSDTFVACR